MNKYADDIVVWGFLEAHRAGRGASGRLRHRVGDHPCLGGSRPDFQIQRYLATCHQHRDDDYYFLIQNTQNRDADAMQIKLDELIRAIDQAHNALLNLEELEEDDLERIRADYVKLAKQARNYGNYERRI